MFDSKTLVRRAFIALYFWYEYEAIPSREDSFLLWDLMDSFIISFGHNIECQGNWLPARFCTVDHQILSSTDQISSQLSHSAIRVLWTITLKSLYKGLKGQQQVQAK